jgi:hypothetical protein
LIITEMGESDPWIDEPLSAIPDYPALQAAAEHARQTYVTSLEDGIVDADIPEE